MDKKNDSLTAQANVTVLESKIVAILGYGTQGHAHALNLRDSGLRVIVAQRKNSPRYQAALESGFEPVEIEDAVQSADLLLFALPDEVAPSVYQQRIESSLNSSHTLGFMHGFAIHYKQIIPPPGVDVILVAPKAQGRAVRSEYVAGRGVPALIGIHQDASGHALDTALGWAAGLGCHRAGLLETNFQNETETDLFGEQAVLCGGLTALIKAGFETLVEAGYPPELAYFECCHEVKLIVDLIYEGGLTYMRERISNTARFGDLTRGPRVVGSQTRAKLREILAEIRSGQFASEWLDENRRGCPRFKELTEADRVHEIERVGEELRHVMFGRPKTDQMDGDK